MTTQRPRILSLLTVVVAFSLAVWLGTQVGNRLDGPDPIDTVEQATRAYANGDCVALRQVSERPASVDCAAVKEVARAYRDERLKPDQFTYALASRSGDVATVRVTYVKDGTTEQELIPLEKRDGQWKVTEVAQTLAR